MTTQPDRVEPAAVAGGGAVSPREPGVGELAELDRLDATGRELAAKARAGSTRAAYDRDWTRFRDWCDQHALTAMPAEPRTLARYLASLASPLTRNQESGDRPEDAVDGHVVVRDALRPSTIARYLASISVRHQAEAPDEPEDGRADRRDPDHGRPRPPRHPETATRPLVVLC